METEAPEAAAPEVETVTTDAPLETEVVGTETTPEIVDIPPTASEIEMSEKFNQITAREKVLRDSEELMKGERDTHGATTAELEETRKILATFKDNPLEGLKALGIEFKEVAERVINDGAPTAEHRVAKLEKQWSDQRQADQDAKAASDASQKEADEKFQAEEQEKAITTTRRDIANLIDEGGDKFEMIKAQGAQDVVFDVAAAHYKETKKLMPWAEAAEKVEAQLVDEVEKYINTAKFKAKYQPVVAKPEVSVEELEDQESNYYAREMLRDKYSKILSNGMSSEGAAAPDPAVWLDDEASKDMLAKKLSKMLEA